MSNWHLAARAADIGEDAVNIVHLGRRVVALYKVDDAYFATSGICPHEGQCFDSGYVENGTVECSLHYAVFEIATGEMICGPATKPLPTYPVKVEDGDIYVAL